MRQDPWLRANELLDARRDPRADAELWEQLDPTARAELELLTRRLARLERSPRPSSARRLAVAALVVLAPLALLWTLRRGQAPESTEQIAHIEAAPLEAAVVPEDSMAPAPARFLDYSFVVETKRGARREITTRTLHGIEHRQEIQHERGHSELVVTRR